MNIELANDWVCLQNFVVVVLKPDSGIRITVVLSLIHLFDIIYTWSLFIYLFVCLFVYGLFNGTVSNSGCVASDGRMQGLTFPYWYLWRSLSSGMLHCVVLYAYRRFRGTCHKLLNVFPCVANLSPLMMEAGGFSRTWVRMKSIIC